MLGFHGISVAPLSALDEIAGEAAGQALELVVSLLPGVATGNAEQVSSGGGDWRQRPWVVRKQGFASGDTITVQVILFPGTAVGLTVLDTVQMDNDLLLLLAA